MDSVLAPSPSMSGGGGGLDLGPSCSRTDEDDELNTAVTAAVVTTTTTTNFNSKLIKSLSAPTTSSAVKNGTSCDDGAAGHGSKCMGRRVSFPADDLLVTGYVEPPNPWENAVELTAKKVIAAYVAACQHYDVTPSVKAIQQIQSLDSFEKRADCLDLQGERLDTGQIEALEEIFKRVQFVTMNLANTGLDDEGATALFDMMEYYESAEKLDISRNRSIAIRGWQACCRMMKKIRCLVELNASGMAIGDNVHILQRTLRAGPSLTVLRLEGCNFSDRNFGALIAGLKVNRTLRELYLASNKLSGDDAVHLANLLRANSRLKLLNLANNFLEDRGVIHVTEGLSDQALTVANDGLSTLVLANNRFTQKAAPYLATALTDSQSLSSLDLGYNDLNNEGVHSLKDALMRNHTLRSLSLHGCQITCEGAVALAEYIADSPTLEMVDLSYNSIEIGGLMALTRSMKINHSVTTLELDGPEAEPPPDVRKQHRELMAQLMEYCDRNHVIVEEKRREAKEAEESAAAARNGIPQEEVLSDPVSRLLSLFSNHRASASSGKRVSSSPPSSCSACLPPPITVSSAAESSPQDSAAPCSGWQAVRGTSYCLKSPQPSPTSSPIPSPTRSRFRVTRVFQDASATGGQLATVGTTRPPPGISRPPPPAPLPVTGGGSGRFNRFKFTVTPVKTINGLDAKLPPLVDVPATTTAPPRNGYVTSTTRTVSPTRTVFAAASRVTTVADGLPGPAARGAGVPGPRTEQTGSEQCYGATTPPSPLSSDASRSSEDDSLLAQDDSNDSDSVFLDSPVVPQTPTPPPAAPPPPPPLPPPPPVARRVRHDSMTFYRKKREKEVRRSNSLPETLVSPLMAPMGRSWTMDDSLAECTTEDAVRTWTRDAVHAIWTRDVVHARDTSDAIQTLDAVRTQNTDTVGTGGIPDVVRIKDLKEDTWAPTTQPEEFALIKASDAARDGLSCCPGRDSGALGAQYGASAEKDRVPPSSGPMDSLTATKQICVDDMATSEVVALVANDPVTMATDDAVVTTCGDRDDASSVGDRDSGIYLLDSTGDELEPSPRTPSDAYGPDSDPSPEGAGGHVTKDHFLEDRRVAKKLFFEDRRVSAEERRVSTVDRHGFVTDDSGLVAGQTLEGSEDHSACVGGSVVQDGATTEDKGTTVAVRDEASRGNYKGQDRADVEVDASSSPPSTSTSPDHVTTVPTSPVDGQQRPARVSFSLVDIDDNYATFVQQQEYSRAWVLTQASTVLLSSSPGEFGKSPSSSSLDLLTGDDDEDDAEVMAASNWPPHVLADADADLMFFCEPTTSVADLEAKVDRATRGESMVSSAGALAELVSRWVCGQAQITEQEEDAEPDGSATEVVGASDHHLVDDCPEGSGRCWSKTSPSSFGDAVAVDKSVVTLARRVALEGSESSNSSDSGVPESPVSCSPPPPERNGVTPGSCPRGKTGLELLMPLFPNRTTNHRTGSSGKAILEVAEAADVLIQQRDGPSGEVASSRRDSTSDCPDEEDGHHHGALMTT